MPICPLCEHAQERGPACESCGRAFDGANLTAPPPPIERIADLEPTAFRSSAPLPEASPDWLERTSISSSPGAEVHEALEVERTSAPPRERRAPAPPSCRYCRAPAAPGDAFCETCGMSLERFRPRAPEPGAEPPRCPSCGAVVTAAACPLCGARLPSPA